MSKEDGYTTIEYVIMCGIMVTVAYIALNVPIDSMKGVSEHVSDAINASVEWALEWKN